MKRHLLFFLALAAANCLQANPLVQQLSVQQPQQSTNFGLHAVSEGLHDLGNSFNQFSEQLRPYMKKEYLIPAGALATVIIGAGIWHRRDIYWAFRNDLPQDLAEKRLLNGAKQIVGDSGNAAVLAGFILNGPLFGKFKQSQEVPLQEQTLRKQDIDKLLDRHAAPCAFNRHFVKRRADSHYNEQIAIFRYEVARQSRLNCGYHAFHNVLDMLRALKLRLFIFEQDNPEGYYARYQSLVNGPDIQALRRITGEHTNINDNDIQSLINSNLVKEEERKDITIIFSTVQGGGALDERLAPIVQALQTGQKNLHAFILCNARDIYKVGGTGGHWVAIVVERVGNGQYHFHTADSLGGDCRPYVNFVATLLQENPLWLEHAGPIFAQLSTALDALRINNNIAASLEQLTVLCSIITSVHDVDIIERVRKDCLPQIGALLDEIGKRRDYSQELFGNQVALLRKSFTSLGADLQNPAGLPDEEEE